MNWQQCKCAVRSILETTSRAATAVDIIDHLRNLSRITVVSLRKISRFLVLNILAKNFIGETRSVEKLKLVRNRPFHEGVVDNVGNPRQWPLYTGVGFCSIMFYFCSLYVVCTLLIFSPTLQNF